MTLLTTNELAQRLGVNRRTLYRWQTAGMPTPVATRELPCGRTRLYDWKPVMEWVLASGRWDEVVDIAQKFARGKRPGTFSSQEAAEATGYVRDTLYRLRNKNPEMPWATEMERRAYVWSINDIARLVAWCEQRRLTDAIR